MEKMYEVEVEKIRIKYEKVIGLVTVSDILLKDVTNEYTLNKVLKEKELTLVKLNSTLDAYNKKEQLTYYNTSQISSFCNLDLHLKQNGCFSPGDILNTKIRVGYIVFTDGGVTLVKESAEEIKKLWEEN